MSEVMLVVVIMFVVFTVGIIPMSQTLRSTKLNDGVDRVLLEMRTAREESVAKLNNQSHGIYFEINSSSADRIIRYQGSSYSSRNSAYDIPTSLDESISVSTTLTGNEVNFATGTGVPDHTGIITLTHNHSGSRSISLNRFGLSEAN